MLVCINLTLRAIQAFRLVDKATSVGKEIREEIGFFGALGKEVVCEKLA
jgi:hypothetical protein